MEKNVYQENKNDEDSVLHSTENSTTVTPNVRYIRTKDAGRNNERGPGVVKQRQIDITQQQINKTQQNVTIFGSRARKRYWPKHQHEQILNNTIAASL